MAFWFIYHLSLDGSMNSNVVNSKEASGQVDFSNWKIHKQKVKTTYKISKFDFNATLSVKDHEKIFSLDEEF